MVLAMQRFNGAIAFVVAAHGDEAEATRATGFTIHDHVGFSDRTMLRKKRGKVLFGGLEGKISYV